MKKITLIISIILCFSIMHYSCKTKAVKNAHCVKVIKSSPSSSLLPESELKVIKSLFAGNRMDYANYQFYQLDTDDLGFKHVKSYQFADNLKVFTEELIFHFNQRDSCYLISGNRISSIGIDAKPLSNRDKVAELFIQKIAQEKSVMVVDATILKGCFDVELGIVGLENSKGKFIKVWKVKPTNKDYPFAYISDENAEIIFYDNGVRY